MSEPITQNVYFRPEVYQFYETLAARYRQYRDGKPNISAGIRIASELLRAASTFIDTDAPSEHVLVDPGCEYVTEETQ